MSYFRKKPIVIEAVQWNPEIKPTELPDWLWKEISSDPDCFDDKTGALTLKTLEGNMLANVGDWIIKGVNGELYPCKNDIFEKTYEAVAGRAALSEGDEK